MPIHQAEACLKTVKLASARHEHRIPTALEASKSPAFDSLLNGKGRKHMNIFSVVRYYDDLPTSGSDSGRAFRDLEWEAWPVALDAKQPVEIEWRSNLGRLH